MLESFSTKDFKQIYKIMEDSFPLCEFRTELGQLSLFENENYRVLGVRESERIIAIAAIWDLDGYIFIEHLATASDKRNGGLGARMLNEIISSSNKRVILEVEPPVDELTKRRVGFYERNSMHINPYPYIQPSLSEGRDPVPLCIMTSHSGVGEDEYQRIKHLLYKYVYKVEQPI